MFASVSRSIVAALTFSACVRGAPTPEHPAAVALEERLGEANADAAENGDIPLWASNGPQPQDIKQTNLSECWLDATMVAITALPNGPDWVASLLSNSMGDRFQDSVGVTLYGPNKRSDGDYQEWTSNVHWTSRNYYLGSDASMANENWWVAAVEVAVLLTAKIFGGDNSLYDGGHPNEALRMLTGWEATRNDDKSTWWQIMQSSEVTPMVVTTIEAATGDMVGGHAYALVGTHVDLSKNNMVELLNPWGPSRQYKLDDIIDSLDSLNYLTSLHIYDPVADQTHTSNGP